jgi:ATP-binding cassette subfamily C protein CydC
MKTFRRLLLFVLPFWPHVLLATLLGTMTIGASISLISTSAYLISMAALHPSIAAISVAVVGVRFFGISRGIFRYLERLSTHSLTLRILTRLRVWFYQSLEPLAPARLVSSRSGDLLNRVMADVETLDNLYVRALAPPLVAVLVILGMSIFMGAFAPILALVITVFLLLIGVGLTILALVVNRLPGRGLSDERANLRADLVDVVQGLPDLLAFGREKYWLERISQAGECFTVLQARMARLSGIQAGLNSLLTGLGVWLLLTASIPLVTSGAIQGVHLAVIVLGAMASFEAVQNLPQAAQMLESNLQSARRLFEIADSSPAVCEPLQPLSRPISADVRVCDLSFSYDDTPVLVDINFDLPAGKKVAIVGPSGAGKSTIINLLMRFWEFNHGDIFLGGQDIRFYSPVDARRMISLVSQGTYLFNASLKENLLLAHPSATDLEIEDACQRAGLVDFVQSLPKGYDTQVGERGFQFSGGERQRVAIARALLKDAPIFVFDEPTANLDPATERHLLNTLRQIPAEKSVLWVTHRLLGLEEMDEILVIDQGRVVERGTHEELLERQGLYWKLWGLQFF